MLALDAGEIKLNLEISHTTNNSHARIRKHGDPEVVRQAVATREQGNNDTYGDEIDLGERRSTTIAKKVKSC